ncbi:MAG: hypothetical protein AAB655_00660 [Patescibacteria group bacterium]
MPEENFNNLEHEALEKDMKYLAGEVQKHRESPEGGNLNEMGLLRKAVESFPVEAGEGNDQVPPTSSDSGPLPDYAHSASDETKLEIEYLLDMAFHKGIAKAQKEAKKSSPFILDAFHDALAGRLYPEMQKRGILK